MILDQIQGLKQEGPSLTKKKGFLSASLLLNMLVPKLPGGKGHPPQMGLFQAVLHFFSPIFIIGGKRFPAFRTPCALEERCQGLALSPLPAGFGLHCLRVSETIPSGNRETSEAGWRAGRGHR